jgi:hypothetical protein
MPAADVDERRDGMRRIGQEHVLARGEAPEGEEGDEQDNADREQPHGSKDPHMLSLERPDAVARVSGLALGKDLGRGIRS